MTATWMATVVLENTFFTSLFSCGPYSNPWRMSWQGDSVPLWQLKNLRVHRD